MPAVPNSESAVENIPPRDGHCPTTIETQTSKTHWSLDRAGNYSNLGSYFSGTKLLWAKLTGQKLEAPRLKCTLSHYWDWDPSVLRGPVSVEGRLSEYGNETNYDSRWCELRMAGTIGLQCRGALEHSTFEAKGAQG